MHGTRTPLRLWFWAGYLVATHHPGISAKQLQRRLGLSRYETAWLILQKLRRAMVAPERTTLTGEVEIDEFYLGGHEEGLKGGCRRGKKALCGVAIEVRGQGSGRLRLAVLPDAAGPDVAGVHQGHDGARRRSCTPMGCSPTACRPSTAMTTIAGRRTAPRRVISCLATQHSELIAQHDQLEVLGPGGPAAAHQQPQ